MKFTPGVMSVFCRFCFVSHTEWYELSDVSWYVLCCSRERDFVFASMALPATSAARDFVMPRRVTNWNWIWSNFCKTVFQICLCTHSTYVWRRTLSRWNLDTHLGLDHRFNLWSISIPISVTHIQKALLVLNTFIAKKRHHNRTVPSTHSCLCSASTINEKTKIGQTNGWGKSQCCVTAISYYCNWWRISNVLHIFFYTGTHGCVNG